MDKVDRVPCGIGLRNPALLHLIYTWRNVSITLAHTQSEIQFYKDCLLCAVCPARLCENKSGEGAKRANQRENGQDVSTREAETELTEGTTGHERNQEALRAVIQDYLQRQSYLAESVEALTEQVRSAVDEEDFEWILSWYAHNIDKARANRKKFFTFRIAQLVSTRDRALANTACAK
eukprot:scpid89833/ scgid24627/ 